MTASVTIDAVNHWFGTFQALREIALEIEAGEYITLLGPSGCGKTTLLSVLGGFVDPSKGRVLIGGTDMTHVPPAKRPTTTVFQDYALFPHMSLRDNVAFGLRMAGIGRAERRRRADLQLDLVGLVGEAHKRPHELSGGQRQRVALARALAVEPDVLLLDEPLGALDLKLRRSMQDELKEIQRKVGTTFVHVTHDQEEAMAIADRIVVMNAGRIEDAGPPERVYSAPATLFAAGFMGEMTRLPATARDGIVETPFGLLEAAPPSAGDLVVCVRPEAIRIGADGFSLGEARVTDTAFFGTHNRVHLVADAVPDLTIVAYLAPAERVAEGDIVPLAADPASIRVFPAR